MAAVVIAGIIIDTTKIALSWTLDMVFDDIAKVFVRYRRCSHVFGRSVESWNVVGSAI